MKQPITKKDIQLLMRHLQQGERDMCSRAFDTLDISDEETSALQALAISEYELLVKPTALDPEIGTGEVRNSFEDLAKWYASISTKQDQRAWDANAVEIIYYSQVFLVQQKRDMAHFVNPLQLLAQESDVQKIFAEMGFPGLTDEVATDFHRIGALAEDFWPVLNKLRTHYGMEALTYDVSGYTIDRDIP